MKLPTSDRCPVYASSADGVSRPRPAASNHPHLTARLPGAQASQGDERGGGPRLAGAPALRPPQVLTAAGGRGPQRSAVRRPIAPCYVRGDGPKRSTASAAARSCAEVGFGVPCRMEDRRPHRCALAVVIVHILGDAWAPWRAGRVLPNSDSGGTSPRAGWLGGELRLRTSGVSSGEVLLRVSRGVGRKSRPEIREGGGRPNT